MESPAVSPSTAAGLTLLGLETIAGIITNVFILFVTLRGLFTGQNMSTSDKILVALCFSNVCYAVIISVNTFCDIFLFDLYVVSESASILYGITAYSVTSCSWLTACLCLFYFFKILNFRRAFLSWVKMKIDAVVPWLILVSEVVSVCASASCMLPNEFQKASSNDLPRNISTNEISGTQKLNLSVRNVVLLNNCLPLLTGIVTTFITAGYLNLHDHRMKKNLGTPGSSSLKAHQTAANTMIRQMIFHAIMYSELIVLCLNLFTKYSFGYWITVIILFSFSPGQGILLIFSNPKLKAAYEKTTRSLPCMRFLNITQQ